jgi:hypothetical protein
MTISDEPRLPPIPRTFTDADTITPDPRHPSTLPPPTRKEILEADAQDAIDRERAEHEDRYPEYKPRHLKITGRSPRSPDFEFGASIETPEGWKRRIDEYVQGEAKRAAVAMLEQRVARVQWAINEWFDRMHSTMWGRGFDLVQNRAAAVEYLLDAFVNVAGILADDLGADQVPDCPTPEKRVILVGPNVNRLYGYAQEHGIDYNAATKVLRHSDAMRFHSMVLDRSIDEVHYVQPFTPSSLTTAIHDLIESRFRTS